MNKLALIALALAVSTASARAENPNLFIDEPMPGAPYQRQADMPVLEGAKNATSDVGAMLGTDPHSAGLANAGWTRNRPDWAGNQ